MSVRLYRKKKKTGLHSGGAITGEEPNQHQVKISSPRFHFFLIQRSWPDRKAFTWRERVSRKGAINTEKAVEVRAGRVREKKVGVDRRIVNPGNRKKKIGKP